MTTVEAISLDASHCRVVHTATGAEIATDGSPELGGGGTSFSATDLLAAALAACTATSVAPILERHGVPAAGLRVAVAKTLAARPSRLSGLDVTIHAGAALDDRLRVMAARAAETCAVKRALSPDLPVTVAVEMEP
ncbi:MAG: OsmC family protein [Actinobacteria bacterium]|nr:OsmC family protein [Actinomycetota bacterium]